MRFVKPVTAIQISTFMPRPAGAEQNPAAGSRTDFLARQNFANPLFDKDGQSPSSILDARIYAPPPKNYLESLSNADETLYLAPKHGAIAKMPKKTIVLPNNIVRPGEFPDPNQIPAGTLGLLPSLKQGHVYCQAAYVEKDGEVVDLPESVLVAYIPAPAQRVAAELDNVDAWAEWHSYFTYSKAVGTSILSSGAKETLHEFRLKIPSPVPLFNKIHDQVRVVGGYVGANWQVTAHLDPNANLQLEKGHVRLRHDDLSWTVYDLPNDGGSLLFYQILTRPDIPVPGLSLFVGKITGVTIKKANPRIAQTVANRAVDPTWTKQRSDNPGEQKLGYSYRTLR